MLNVEEVKKEMPNEELYPFAEISVKNENQGGIDM